MRSLVKDRPFIEVVKRMEIRDPCQELQMSSKACCSQDIHTEYSYSYNILRT